MNIRVAVVGMGYWGKNLVRNFYEMGNLKVICDSNSSRQVTISEKYPGIEFRQDYQAVLDDDSIQAIVIATPAITHLKMTKQALEAGKDVFVEKPLALNVAEGKELMLIAARKQQILMVGHILHYHPAIIKLKELINEGTLGRIQYIYSNRLSIGKIRTEENILWSFAPHDISVILGLLNEEPCEITCTGGAYLNKDIADVTMSQFLFPSGVQAHIHVSWLHPFKEQRLVVIGSDKMAVFDDTISEKLKIYPHKVEWKNRIPTAIKAESEVVELPVAEPLRSECEHFISCIENRTRPLTDGDEGLRVLKILNECQKSMDGNSYDNETKEEIEEKAYFVHETAVVDEPCDIGAGTKIWHFSHVMKGAKIGERCIFGQNVNIDANTVIGNNVKVQNNVSIYTGVKIEDDVFLGPSCVLTNVTNPRSQVVRHSLYEKTLLKRGASIGANATIVCGITIGRYAFVGAGAVVAKDVPDYAMMIGVPARRIGWISRHGLPLKNPDEEGIYTCPESGLRYKELKPNVLKCLDLDEEESLPESMREGKVYYDSLVHPT
ncbi:MAG: Gfo/Idh/MocA family oxidoreductase [Candidatus Electryonea clarkiae]|nr:Gfo/Idh/MocA family oxidoreductase [Candidatus Electryonea clarkiae]MDP8285852.1 Gfo/Idh/MocA family oxidoreductase [Candidatus Electryonea clarkiae]